MSTKLVLNDYQQETVDFMLSRPAAGVFLDPGLGKTVATLETFRILKEADVIDTLVVIAKRFICHNTWPREIEKWGYDFKYQLIHGTIAKREAMMLGSEVPDIMIFTYEGADWVKQTINRFKLRKKYGRMMLVLDESTKVKSWKADRTKSLRGTLNWYDRRYILTGTPTANHLLDIHAQVFMLDQNETLGSKTAFKNTYFKPVGYMGYQFEPLPGAEEAIYERLKDLVIRFDTDSLDMPPKKEIYIDIKLDEAAYKAYKNMEDHLIHLIEDGTVTASTAAVATQKCRQIASGAIYADEDGTKTRGVAQVHDFKIEALKELIDELNGKPVLVAYEFRHEVEKIRKALGKSIPYIGGGVSAKQADSIINKWNLGKTPILLGQPQSIAHGLNLQGINAAIVFYSIGWSLENYTQFIQRIWRQGQTGTVLVYHLVAQGTVDELIVHSLSMKNRSQKKLLDLLKSSLIRKEPKMALQKTSSAVLDSDYQPSTKKKQIRKKSAAKKPTVSKSPPKKKAAPKKAAPKKSVAKKSAKKKAPTSASSSRAPANPTIKVHKDCTKLSKPESVLGFIQKLVGKKGMKMDAVVEKTMAEFKKDAAYVRKYMSYGFNKKYISKG